jgi:hypothetical protein
VISALKYRLPLPHDSLLHIAFNFDRTSNLVGPHRAAARRHFLASTGIRAIPDANIGSGEYWSGDDWRREWDSNSWYGRPTQRRVRKSHKFAQKALALLGDWSVTVGAFGASFGH